MPALRVAGTLRGSRANGPGLRAVLWTQGCDLGCPGCFNPSTHSHEGGALADPEDLASRFAEWIAIDRLDGATVSGGEPLQQAAAVARFLESLRRRSADAGVVLFTGYTLAETARIPDASAVLAHTDLLVAGRYAAGRRHGRGLLGSLNQRLHHLTDRYASTDLDAVPTSEVVILPTGEVVVSGVDPPDVGELGATGVVVEDRRRSRSIRSIP
jgi:anaerobic ribonucleoside-triphosphate reductase activating protein